MRRVPLLRSCLLLLFAGTILTAGAEDWPYYQYDPEHTGRSPAVVDAAKLMPSWTAPDGYATPQIVGDTVYSTKSQGGFSGTRQDGTQWATYISAFDLQTGAIKWTHSGNYVFCSHAAVGGGLVVFHGGVKSSSMGPPTPGAQQLLVLDAATGALRYKVSLPAEPNDSVGEIHMMPLLVPNPSDGTVMAYCNGLSTLWSVQLGPTNGSVVWKQRVGASEFGAQSMPTLVEDALFIGGTNQLFAFDRISGTPIFVDEDRRGGGARTAVYDAARGHIYTPGIKGLSAFRYVSNAQIEFLWHRDGGGENGIGNSSIAIAPDGKIYVPGSGFHFYELDPDTGATLRSVPGSFGESIAPSITTGLLWMPNTDGSTRVYNLDTLQLVRTLPGYNNSGRYPGAGAFTDGYFLMARGDTVFAKGFDVWPNPPAQAMNISTRLRVGEGENVMIGGFIIDGSEPKRVLIRALGPTLQQFDVPGVLPNPMVELSGRSGPITGNNNWKDTQEAEIRATGLAPPNEMEAALVVTLDPGHYTAVIRDVNGATGVGLVEVYDLAPAASAKLANVSTRGFVESGDNVMIGGFILGNGAASRRLLIRAIGPSLSEQGVNAPLPDPVLELRDSNGMLIRDNDNWRASQQAEIEATGLAPEKEAESAIIAMLAPAAYTAIVAGKNSLAGVGLVEVYQLP
jgi:hypothetical protein